MWANRISLWTSPKPNIGSSCSWQIDWATAKSLGMRPHITRTSFGRLRISFISVSGVCSGLTIGRINYHSAVLDIFRPFLSTRETLRTFGSDKCKPSDIFWASVRQLRQIVMYHPLVHKSAAYSIFWHIGLLHVANSSLEAPRDPQSQFFYLLCMISYHKLSASFPIIKFVTRGLLTAAVTKGIITDGMARALQLRFQENSWQTSVLEGSFMLDFGLATKDPRSARAAALAKQFDLVVLGGPGHVA